MQDEAALSGARLIMVRFFNALGKPFGINPFPRSFANPTVAGASDRTMVFDSIYRSNFWASSESRSGAGSEAAFAAGYRERLRKLLQERGMRRVFDAPCGDLNWILPLARDPAITFAGGDISPQLVGDLRASFPDIDLVTFDICEDDFPAADVWHCRDCLFHLPFADIRRALEKFVQSEIPHALLTTHRARVGRNLDVTAGGFRYLDLEKSPIALPRAEAYLKDYSTGRDFPRFVGLWSRTDIANALERTAF